ncbi:MFS general substrate transporter, partial [Aureobasidium melanogenum]
SNQSRAFTYLPVVYGIGGITGPLVGGLLVFETIPWSGKPNPYPYLAPNALSAGVLLIDFVLTLIFLEESLEEAKDLPPLKKRVSNLFAWLWQFTGNSTKPSYVRRHEQSTNSAANARSDGAEEDSTDDESDGESTHLLGTGNRETLSSSAVFNRDTILLLITFLIFQLSNISYNSLYPIFAQAVPPTGRGLSPEEIGLSLGFAGLVTIVFQVGIFGKLREKVGNKMTYRVGLLGFVIAFLLMPWVGYRDGKDGSGHDTQAGKVWLWIELGGVLIIKTVAAVGGLTSALLLITNSAPNHGVLGTLNGLAQTLSAAGRAAGPFISGSLFTAATHVQPKGEALAFGIFGGISLLGFALSFGIRSSSLEAEGWDESDDDDDASSDEEEV